MIYTLLYSANVDVRVTLYLDILTQTLPVVFDVKKMNTKNLQKYTLK